MGPEFQKAADLLASCLRQAADCLDQGADYEAALGELVLLDCCSMLLGGLDAAVLCS